jgi:hypothetical protein
VSGGAGEELMTRREVAVMFGVTSATVDPEVRVHLTVRLPGGEDR